MNRSIPKTLKWDREHVEASDVMRSNAKTARTFPGQVVGKFVRVGPNSWDPYSLVAEDGQTVDGAAGPRDSSEERGVRFRVRAYGSVYVVEWRPDDGESGDAASLRAPLPGDLRHVLPTQTRPSAPQLSSPKR